MRKSNPFNRTIAGILFVAFLFMGCGEAEPPQVKPVVVKKRIAEKTPPVESEKKTPPIEKIETKVDSPAMPKTDKRETASIPTSKEDVTASGQGVVKAAEPTAAEGSALEASLLEKIANETPRYDPQGKIDPFESLFKETPKASDSAEAKQKPSRPLTPLEKIDLSQLKLVGIIRADSGNRALVEDATGKGYIITKGTYIGVHGGQVVEILKDGAVIEEEVEDILGKITVSRNELKLQKPAGEE